MKKETILVHSGRKPEEHNGTVNPPIYQTSTVIFPTLKSYLDADKGQSHYDEKGLNSRFDYSYAIGGTATTFALQEALAALEGGDCCWIVPSGLSAITVAILSFVQSGDHLLIPDTAYSPTRRFCNVELKKLGIETSYYDPLIAGDINDLIRKNTRLVFLESPGSLTYEVQDIPAITKVARKHGVVTIIDNTWATPLYLQPLSLGVDVSLQAITKYINGHADVLLGSIVCKEVHRKAINQCFKNHGQSTSPFAAYQALRGLRTLDVRLERHQQSALKIAKWLQKHKRVERVLYPALPSDPGYKLWKRDFSGANGLLSFVLDKKYTTEALAKLTDNLKFFDIGVSWGGFESLILPFFPETTRTVTAKRWKNQGSCIRIHVGLENIDDLIGDLEQGLKKL